MRKILFLSLLIMTGFFFACGDSGGGGTVVIGDCDGAPTFDEANLPAVAATDETLIGTFKAYVNTKDESDNDVTVCMDVKYKDINRSGSMDTYEDWTKTAEERVAALVADTAFTTEMKAGLLVNVDVTDHALTGVLSTEQTAAVTAGVRMFRTTTNEISARSRGLFANSLQAAAETGAIAIPVLLTSNFLPSYPNTANGMSLFPGMPGVGAATVDDLDLATGIGSDVAQDLRAIGVGLVFGPQADLATELRWWGSTNLLGEDAATVGSQVAAIVKGLQGGDSLASTGVAAVVNYFPGAGPQKNGLDSRDANSTHMIAYGSDANLDYHIQPFENAITAGACGIMAAHGAPEGTSAAEISVSYNEDLLTTRLKGTMEYTGLVFSDWGALDTTAAVGVTASTTAEKINAMIAAGCDVITGVSDAEASTALDTVKALDSAVIDADAEKVLLMMFKLGLFENPYLLNFDGEIDGTVARDNVGLGANGTEAMSKQVVVLKNTEKSGAKAFLPMDPGVPYVTPGSNHYWIDDSELFSYDEAEVDSAGYSKDTNSLVLWGNYSGGTFSDLSDSDNGYTRFSDTEPDYLLTKARKLYAQYITHFIDAPRKDVDDAGTSDPDGLLSYYYDLDEGVSGQEAADNASVLAKVRENSDLVNGWDGTIYVVIVNMERPGYVLNEIYNLADCVILHWGSNTKYLFDTLHNVDAKLTEGRLPVSLPATNVEVEGGDSAVPTDVDSVSDTWRKRGHQIILTPLSER